MNDILFAVFSAAATIVGVVALLNHWEAENYRAMWEEAEDDLEASNAVIEEQDVQIEVLDECVDLLILSIIESYKADQAKKADV